VRARSQGFTLVEILVALGIFAVLGLASSQLMTRIIEVRDTVSARGARLAELQRAMDVLQRDVLQATQRPVRDELGDELPALRVAPDVPLELTRLGQRNPLALPRSEAIRTAYVLADGALVRLIWPVLDRANDTLPLRQTLLTDVDAFEVEIVDVSGNEHGYWPPVGDVGEDPATRLAGIKVAITAAPFGDVQRIWEIAQMGNRWSEVGGP